jgi:hypothetical protein
MATLYITEFAPGGLNVVQAAICPPLAQQTVPIGAGSAASAAFGTSTGLVRLQPDATCSIAFGFNPSATAAAMRLSAGQTEYFVVQPGSKVAAITNT